MGQSTPGPGSQKPDTIAGVQRPARVLLGWLDEQQAYHFLSGQRRDIELTENEKHRAERARRAVTARPAGVDQTRLVEEVPADLGQYLESFKQSPAAQPFFSEGWSVALVNLARVCALQPQVYADHAEERVAGLNVGDFQSIARVTLPLPTENTLPAQFDEQQRAWLITAQNPNLRIVGHFGGPLQPGVVGFGFVVNVLQSFVQVANINGRYVLRDGYHRAYGLLRRGITKAPVLIRKYEQFQDLALPPGLLPPSVYLGERPPTLRDYDDDEVSAELKLPATQKMLIIQGLELNRIG